MPEPVAYTEAAPHRALWPYVCCTWTSEAPPAASSDTVVLPDACLDLVWDGARLFVAGPDTGPVRVSQSPGSWFAGVRFRPGAAPAVLGLPASALRDQRVALDDIRPAAAARLGEELGATGGPAAAVPVLTGAVERWAAEGGAPDPLVADVVRALSAGPRRRPVATLADDLGIGPRHLLRRCTEAVGYGPKVLDRVLRLRRFLDAAPAPGRLAVAAAEAGYADQAHLVRDCQRLAGTTPSALLA